MSELNLDRIFGFVLNVPVDGLLGRLNPLSYVSERKHWVAIKKINSVWLDLDSKLSQPRPIGDVSCVRDVCVCLSPTQSPQSFIFFPRKGRRVARLSATEEPRRKVPNSGHPQCTHQSRRRRGLPPRAVTERCAFTRSSPVRSICSVGCNRYCDRIDRSV